MITICRLVKVLSLNVWLMKLLVDYKYLQAFKQLQSVLKLLLLADVFFVHNIGTSFVNQICQKIFTTKLILIHFAQHSFTFKKKRDETFSSM